MTLDTRIRSAVEETVQAPIDIEHGLAALRRTRRQRAATRLGACAVAVALLLTGVLVRQHDARPEPAPAPGSVGNGLVLALSLGGAVEQLGDGARLPTLPGRIDPLGPFRFTSDGHGLIYAWHRQVRSVDLATGTETVLTPCPDRACLVSVDATGTKVAISGRRGLSVRDLSSGAETRYLISGGAAFVTWLPGGREVTFLTRTNQHLWLARLAVDSGHLSRLVRLPGELYTAPAWSPDGTRLAFIEQVDRGHRMPRLRVSTVSADGGGVRVLHGIGRCYCIRYVPAVTWSPDGERIAVTLAGDNQVGGSVYTLRPDGSDWRRLAEGRYQDRLAWQPSVTPSR